MFISEFIAGILSLVMLLTVFAYNSPILFFISVVIITVIWILILKNLNFFIDRLNLNTEKADRRKEALRIAKIYLSPYSNIWSGLKLSNKYCYLKLESDGVSIIGKEKVHPYRKFKVLTSHVHNYSDLWNMFCKNFNHYKTYDDLVDDCKLYALSIYEYYVKPEVSSSKVIHVAPTKPLIEKLDINNCSEIELTALPGISIVMAKKAIKKREEINGFKRIEDFFIFMKLKPHMEKQLRERICVKKMKVMCKKINHNSERSVDL